MNVAEKIGSGGGFSKDDLNPAMSLIREFSDQIREGKLLDAGAALSKISDALFGAGRWGELQEIEDLFPALVKSDTSLRNLMIQASMCRVFRHDAQPDAMQVAKGYLRAAWDILQIY